MKILITTDWYCPAINGVVTSVLNLKKELIKEGNVFVSKTFPVKYQQLLMMN